MNFKQLHVVLFMFSWFTILLVIWLVIVIEFGNCFVVKKCFGYIYHELNPLTTNVAMSVQAHGNLYLIKHPVPDRVKPSLVIFDIRALDALPG